jgi:hypothetical protein
VKDIDGFWDVVLLWTRYGLSKPFSLVATALGDLACSIAGFRRVVSTGIFEHNKLGFAVFTRGSGARLQAGQWHEELETARTSLVFAVDCVVKAELDARQAPAAD